MKTILTKAWLLAMLVAVAFTLTACGGTGGGQGGSGSAGADHSMDKQAGMDHDQMDDGMMGMGSGGMAEHMVMENGEYSDEAFIDAMAPHHQGAIEMAKVAHEKCKIPEIQKLAENIVSSQQREIEQMGQWQREWYPED